MVIDSTECIKMASISIQYEEVAEEHSLLFSSFKHRSSEISDWHQFQLKDMGDYGVRARVSAEKN